MKVPKILKLRRLKIRRGNEIQRKDVLFEEGEPVFTKDNKRVYIGDNKTIGGISSTTRNYVKPTAEIPPDSKKFDIIYAEDKKQGLIIEKNGNLRSIFPSFVDCCINIKKDIDIIAALLTRMEIECCNPDLMLIRDDEDKILTDQGVWIKLKDYKYPSP